MKACVQSLWNWVRVDLPGLLLSLVFDLISVAAGLLFLALSILLFIALAYFSWVISQKVTAAFF